jgi:transcriptional regulator NrdR family protein
MTSEVVEPCVVVKTDPDNINDENWMTQATNLNKQNQEPVISAQSEATQNMIAELNTGHFLAQLDPSYCNQNPSSDNAAESCAKVRQKDITIISHPSRPLFVNSGPITAGYECQYCKKMFFTLEAIADHVSMYHPKLFACSYCKEKFRSILTCREHERTDHINDKKKKCPLCNKNYVSLESHMTVHLNEFSDDDNAEKNNSNKKLKKTSNIPKHMLPNKKQNNSCDVCGKSFMNAQKLKNHATIHVEDCIVLEEEQHIVVEKECILID